jgi:hypothetical protein
LGKEKKLSAVQRRIIWVLENLYGGSRSAMAKGTGVSLTGIIKVVTGQQDAGRQLLEKVATNRAINPGWLLTGEGAPLRGAALPVAEACLPGLPEECCDHFIGETVPEVAELYSPTRYWLKLNAAEWAVQPPGTLLLSDSEFAAETKLATGDLLLMESASDRFPTMEGLHGRWCVVRRPGRGAPEIQLARLEYTPAGEPGEPAGLYALSHQRMPLKVQRLTLDEYPGGVVKVHRSEFIPNESQEGSHARTQPVLPSFPRRVDPSYVVAVCVLVVRRFG